MEFQGYKIGIAKIKDLSSIMKFFSDEWSPDHILSKDKDFFLYQYGSQENLNFVLAKDIKGSISATLGFIPTSADKNSPIFTTMWKVSNNSSSATLGLKLFSYLQDLNIGPLMSVGINEKTEDIYKLLKLHVGSLEQYFIPNKNLKRFQIAQFSEKIFQDSQKKEYLTNWTIDFIDPHIFKDFFLTNSGSLKDFDFIKRRYCDHPYFKYKFLGAFNQKNLISLMIIREVSYKNSKALRIIDYFGEEVYIAKFTLFLKELIVNNAYEYIDFFCFGLDQKNLQNAGFSKSCISDHINIIPDHFDPFHKKNIAIKFFAQKDKIGNLKLFKGDGDQDCPRRFKK